MGRLPEAYVALPAVRELRQSVRHQARLVGWRSGPKASVHAVLAKQGLHIGATYCVWRSDVSARPAVEQATANAYGRRP
jgi:hypothetical protein